MDFGDSKKATALLVNLLNTIKDSESPPAQWSIEAQDALRACLASTGNVFRTSSTNTSGNDLTVNVSRLAIA